MLSIGCQLCQWISWITTLKLSMIMQINLRQVLRDWGFELYRCNYRYCTVVVICIYMHAHAHIYTLSRVVHRPFSKHWIIFIQLHHTIYFHGTVFHGFVSNFYVVNLNFCVKHVFDFLHMFWVELGGIMAGKWFIGILFQDTSLKTTTIVQL